MAARSQRRLYYEQAVSAFQRGDVDSAFSRMESLFRLGHRSGGKSTHDADSTYEKFFQEVRNSQDELTRAYNDGRRLLAESNYQDAIKICTDLLQRYPANAQLKALRIDAEDQEQRDLSAFIADIGRRLESEPDLDKKVKILEEAVNRHPAEAHFINKLKTTRSRRDMVQSIIDQKLLFERQGNFTGALAQLKALQQIHPQYQGVERELERLGQRLREQREEEKKAEWERQIQHEIDAGDWQRAEELLGRAQEEFKGDAGLKAMETLIDKAKERVNSAWEGLAAGQALISEGNLEAGLETLRGAREANAREPHFLARLGSVYLEAAERIYEQDWKAAERLIEEALNCDPTNQSASDLKNTLRERKRRDVVNLCLTKARELEADSRIEDAIQVVQQGLTEYSDEIRLQQLRDRYFRLRPDLAPKPSSPEKQVADSVAVQDQSTVAPTESWVLPVKSNSGEEPAAREAEKPVEKPRASKNEAIEKWKKSLSGRSREIAVGAAAVVAILLVFWGIRAYKVRPRHIEAPKLAAVKVVVNNGQPGEYRIVDGAGTDVTNQLSSGLPPGNYVLEASKLGFEKVQQSFIVDPSKESTPLEIAWKRLPVALTIKLTKAEGSLKVDNTEQTLDAGLEHKTSWQNGPHTISWQGPQGDSLEVQFDINDDGVEMKSPPTSQGRFVGIIATLSRGKVTYQAIHTGKLLKIVDGQPETLGAAGEFSIEDSKGVSFKAHPGGFPLGDFPTGQPGQPLVYVYLAPQHPAPTHRGNEDKPIERVADPSPAPPTPPPPNKEDLSKKKRDDYLKSLGVEVTPK